MNKSLAIQPIRDYLNSPSTDVEKSKSPVLEEVAIDLNWFAQTQQCVNGLHDTVIDLEQGDLITLLMGDQDIHNLRLANPPVSGEVTIRIKQPKRSKTVNWPENVVWAGGSPPDLSEARDTIVNLSQLPLSGRLLGYAHALERGRK